MNETIAILTGDIMNSREEEATLWLPQLKNTLNRYGGSPKEWDIYRGDSFQLIVPAPQALIAALHLKASIKEFKNLDVRIAIGLGDINHKADRITESNGTAFLHSGEGFENLKKQTLSVSSENMSELKGLQIMLDLAMHIADDWTPSVAQLVKTYMEHPDKQQKEIAKILDKSQSTVSETLSRSAYEQIIAIQTYYEQILITQ